MQLLARFVIIAFELFVYSLYEKTLGSVAMVAATALVFRCWHGSYQSFSLIESVAYSHLLRDQTLNEFLVEFKGACLSNLISRVDRDHSRGWVDDIN